MLTALFASGLLLQASSRSDVENTLAQLQAAKAAYGRCLFERANALYSGSDNPQLERAVMDQCGREQSAYEAVMTEGASSRARDAGLSAFESMLPGLVHMTVSAVASCNSNANRLGASDRSLCATGGY